MSNSTATANPTQIPGSPDPWWEDGALRAIEQLASTGRPIIERTGYAPSRRPSRSKSVTAVWRGAAA